MSGLRREAPCSTSSLKVGINTCPVQTKDVIQQLKNDSLIFPPWGVPSYRSALDHTLAMSSSNRMLVTEKCTIVLEQKQSCTTPKSQPAHSKHVHSHSHCLMNERCSCCTQLSYVLLGMIPLYCMLLVMMLTARLCGSCVYTVLKV